MNIAVAQQYMARDLHWSDIQVGGVLTAFLVGYTLFQIPGGILGDRFGPRLVLAISGLWWGATTVLTGVLPGYIFYGSAAFVAVIVLRFLHGVGQATTYPVAITAVSQWFPLERHAFIASLIFTGSTAGSAFAPPLVAHIMNWFGWRATFYWTGVLPVALAFFWFIGTRRFNTYGTASVAPSARFHLRDCLPLLRSRNVLALCASYFLYCYAISIYVYWLFKYLVDVRHLNIVNSGWANSLPWIAASVAVPVVAWIGTRLAPRTGIFKARRLVAIVCLIVAALLMYLGATTEEIGLAISAITLSVALLFSTESSYWSTSIEVAPENAGTSGGLMNLAGNLGGVAATSLVPVLVLHFGWLVALSSGSVFALFAALTWFAIAN
jgi:ACS family glucarate transporter-like MFS transporter